MTKNNSSLKHAIIYSASGVLGKAVGFIMLPVYANYLHGEGYGIIGMIDVVLTVLTLLIGYGIQGAMTRFYFDKKEGVERQKFISTSILLMFILVLIVSSPALIFYEQVALLAFGKEGIGLYILIAVLTFIASMTEKSAETYILIQKKSLVYAFLSLLKLTLALSLNIFFIVHLELGVLGYLYSGLIVAIVFTCALHYYAFRRVGIHFVKEDAIAILKFTVPLLPGYVAIFLRNSTDRVLLRTFYGLSTVGAYEMLFKFVTLIGFLIVEPFSKIWGVERFEIARKANGPATMAKVFTLQLSVMLFVGLVLSIEIPILLKILTPSEFWIAGPIVGIAVLSRIILASYYHFFFGLLYSKKTYKISIIQSSSMVVNVVFGLLLIKPYGISGAVFASFISNIFQCLIAYRMAKPYYYIPFEWRKIFSITFAAILLFIMIETFTITDIEVLRIWVNSPSDLISNVLNALHIDTIKDGKLATYIIENKGLMLEGFIKFLLCFLFFIGLILTGILPFKKIKKFIKR